MRKRALGTRRSKKGEGDAGKDMKSQKKGRRMWLVRWRCVCVRS